MKWSIGLAMLVMACVVGCAPESPQAEIENVQSSEAKMVVNVYKIRGPLNTDPGLLENYTVEVDPVDDPETYIWRTLEQVAAAIQPSTGLPVGTNFDLYTWYYRDADELADPPRLNAECQDLPF